MKRNFRKTTAENFEEKFDNGEDISDYIDWSSARRPGLAIKRINADLPQWMIDALDEEARRLGVARLPVLKMWLASQIEANRAKRAA